MGLPLMILRFVATPILGIAIFAGLLLTLVGNNIVDKLLNADFIPIPSRNRIPTTASTTMFYWTKRRKTKFKNFLGTSK